MADLFTEHLVYDMKFLTNTDLKKRLLVVFAGSLKRTLEEDEDFGNMQVQAAQNG